MQTDLKITTVSKHFNPRLTRSSRYLRHTIYPKKKKKGALKLRHTVEQGRNKERHLSLVSSNPIKDDNPS